MCKTCGCGDEATANVINLQTGKEIDLKAEQRADEKAHRHHGHGHHHDHDHHHDHAHDHDHDHDHGREPHTHSHDVRDRRRQGETLSLQERILAKNDAIAAENRAWFAGREILAINLMSSPGAGKTTLLERTIARMKDEAALFVIEGDQATSADGERIRAAGAAAVQINTGAGCHLEADMVARGLMELRPSPGSILMIENVGNLVCPALFDLGEHCKAVVLSVTEGDDKPLKYPHMFRAARLMLINKIDLAPYVDFNVERCIENARRVNPDIEAMQVSAKTGEGFDAWRNWILRNLASTREQAFARALKHRS